MTNSGFAAQLAQDLDPEDVRLVLEVFRQDVERLAGVLGLNAAAGDMAGFRRTTHALAGAAGAVGAVPLELACRDAMTRADLAAAQLPAIRQDIQALAVAALEATEQFLATLPLN